MKTNMILICLLASSIFGFSQSIPPGEYYTENDGIGFHLDVDDQNQFKIAMAKGAIETDSTINLVMPELRTPPFGIKFIDSQSISDSIEVQFSNTIKNYQLNSIMVSTSNNIVDPDDYKKVSDLIGPEYYDLERIVFKLPRKKYLHLFEDQNRKTSTSLFSFEIPSKINSLEVYYNRRPTKKFTLMAEYNEDEESVTVKEAAGKNPLVFYRDYDEFLAQFETPASVVEDYIYKDQIKTEASSYNSSSTYSYKLEIPQAPREAIKRSISENKAIFVFYAPNNSKIDGKFEDFIKNYETRISNLMYDRYNPQLDRLIIQLAKKPDHALVKTHKPSSEDEALAIAGDGTLLYRHKGSFLETSDQLLNDMIDLSNHVIDNLHLSKRLDDAIASQFDKKEVQEIFVDLSKFNSYDFFSGHEAVKQQNYRIKSFEDEGIYFYHLKSDPSEVANLFKKLVDSHKKDQTIDFDYALMLFRHLSLNYKSTLYKDYTIVISETDLAAIDYLLTFEEKLSYYQPPTNDDYYDDYPFNNLSNAITRYFKQNINSAPQHLWEEIKNLFKKVTPNQSEYLRFVEDNMPSFFLDEYKMFYESSSLNSNQDVILSIDHLYTAEESTEVWSFYKNSIANQANEAAWMVVENENEKHYLKDALKWSKTSIDIETNNPYFLDTYAQLLYQNKNKKQAIEFQRKAVDIIENNPSEYSQNLYQQIKEVLVKMQNGTY